MSKTSSTAASRSLSITIGFAALFMIFSVALSVYCVGVRAQETGAKGSISGKVMIDGKPASGVLVVAVSGDRALEFLVNPDGNRMPRSYKATTGPDGRYRISDLAAASYRVSPSAPNLLNGSQSFDDTQKKVVIEKDDSIDDVNFSLLRGGVITGRVTDPDGKPAIAAQIDLSMQTQDDPTKSASSNPRFNRAADYEFGRFLFFTDDRGIYRVYGLAPGRYSVAAGGAGTDISELANQPRYRLTYYPGVTDSSAARFVEVAAGEETTGIDIQIAPRIKGFSVSGRLLDSVANTPVSNMLVTIMPTSKESETSETSSFFRIPKMVPTDAKGQFRFEALTSGKYELQTVSLDEINLESNYFADPVDIEINEANVTGLIVKMMRGASISGVVQLENVFASQAELSRIFVVARGDEIRESMGSGRLTRVAADGTFRLGGLRAGQIRLSTNGADRSNLFQLIRVMRDDAEVSPEIDVQANEQIAGLRLIVRKAVGVIRGHCDIQGTIPTQSAMIAILRPVEERSPYGLNTEVDPSGDWTFESVMPGSYTVEVVLTTQNYGKTASTVSSGRQSVTVPLDGSPVELNVSLDLKSAKKP